MEATKPLPFTGYVCKQKGCRNRFCPKCGIHLGIKLRERLAKRIQSFTGVIMWTLTVDPQLFETPEQAYRYVHGNRLIARLVADLLKLGQLSSGSFWYVLEWQQNGWPHWHLLVDSTYVDFGHVCRIWNRFRPPSAPPLPRNSKRPAFGSVRFSAPKFKSREHACNYATKYLTKPPKCDYPAWVLGYKGQIRRYGVSHGFWGDGKKRETSSSQVELHDLLCECEKCTGVRKTVGERRAACGKDGVILSKSIEHREDGRPVISYHFCASLPMLWATFCTVFNLDPSNREHVITREQMMELSGVRSRLVTGDERERLEKLYREWGERERVLCDLDSDTICRLLSWGLPAGAEMGPHPPPFEFIRYKPRGG